MVDTTIIDSDSLLSRISEEDITTVVFIDPLGNEFFTTASEWLNNHNGNLGIAGFAAGKKIIISWVRDESGKYAVTIKEVSTEEFFVHDTLLHKFTNSKVHFYYPF